MTYKFECDYFTPNSAYFINHLSKYKDTKLDCLEIGSFEGRSAVWMLENILTHPQSSITCVESNGMDSLNILSYNLSEFADKVRLIIQPSTLGLSTLIVEKRQFDFIYIDGQHDEYMPLSDLVMAHELLKVGGIMAVDDYLLPDSKEYGKCTIRKCFDNFIEVYQEYYERFTAPDSFQQWMRKCR